MALAPAAHARPWPRTTCTAWPAGAIGRASLRCIIAWALADPAPAW